MRHKFIYGALLFGALLLGADLFAGSAAGVFSSYTARSLVGLVDQTGTATCTEDGPCYVRTDQYGAVLTRAVDASGATVTNAGTNLAQVNGQTVDIGISGPAGGTQRVGLATGSIPCDNPSTNIYFRWANGTSPSDQILLAVGTSPSTSDELVLCSYQVKCSGDNTSPVDITSIEADDTADITLDSEDGVPAGGGFTAMGPIALGGSGRDLLLTAENPSDACVFTGVGYLR